MTHAQQANDEQLQRWNGIAGRAWVDAQDVLDAMFRPLEERLTANIVPGDVTLDVGCGTGSTTIAAARRAAPHGRAVGVDISAPMLAAARARAEGVAAEFIEANAQEHAFAPATFDRIQSRFGVMFFDDPVAAFANLRRAAKDGAALHLIAWRGAAENPFMTTAERAAAPFLPNLPPRRPDGPGQFAFADASRVRGILDAAGWTNLAIEPIDVACSFAADDLRRYATRLGPVGLILHEADEETRTAATEAVLAAFAPYVDGDEVRFTAACWEVRARNAR